MLDSVVRHELRPRKQLQIQFVAAIGGLRVPVTRRRPVCAEGQASRWSTRPRAAAARFARGFRRSELVALDAPDLEFVRESLKAFVATNKID
jgi:hypothetical protein